MDDPTQPRTTADPVAKASRPGQFVKGADPRRGSGARDPNRPDAEELRELKAAIAKEGWPSLLVLMNLRDEAKDPRVKLRACEYILDRVLGKAAQPICGVPEGEPVTVGADDGLLELMRKLAKP